MSVKEGDIQLKLRSELGREHHTRNGVLPPFALHQEESIFVQALALEVDHVLDRGGPVAFRKRRFDNDQCVTINVLVGGPCNSTN